MSDIESRAGHLKRFKALQGIRQSSWDGHWRELADYIAPRRTRFFQTEATTPGRKKESHIINNTAGLALRTCASGIMTNVTPQARAWFRLTTPNADLAELPDVREWLHYVEDSLRTAMLKSNLYSGLQTLYVDLPLFGTGALFLDNDGPGAIRVYPMPVGEYCLAQSERGVVDTLYRETSLTVAQLVKKFGEKSCSVHVRELYRKKNLDTLIEVLHVVCPREDYDTTSLSPQQMPFASCWFERNESVETGYLRESGYEVFPVVAPRWSVTSGSDAYGYSPGMEILGDVKQLQAMEKRKALVGELIASPPVNAPVSMQGSVISLLPDAVNYVENMAEENQVKPALVVNPQALSAMDQLCREIEGRIDDGFYSKLWLSLTNDEGAPPTAREVMERHNEKMEQLGPVFDRLNDELLNPVVERYYHAQLSAGLLRPPPKALSGQPLRIEYTSIMAQALKASAFGSLENLMAFAASLAAVRPDVADKINVDEAVDIGAEALGVPPKVINNQAKVQAVRQQRAKQAAQQASMGQALAASQAAMNLGRAKTTGDTALGGVAAAAAGQPAGAQ